MKTTVITGIGPRVVIDLEKLRRINCGLGRFSLHLAEGILSRFRSRIDPVFLLPKGARPPSAPTGTKRSACGRGGRRSCGGGCGRSPGRFWEAGGMTSGT